MEMRGLVRMSLEINPVFIGFQRSPMARQSRGAKHG